MKKPRVIDVEQARRDEALGGSCWAAWRQKVHVRDLEAALNPPPEPEVDPARAWTPTEHYTPPAAPARKDTLTPRRPVPQESYVPAPSLNLPRRAAPPVQATKAEIRQVHDAVRLHGPMSRALLMSWCTGMRLPTLDAVLKRLTEDGLIVCSDGRYVDPTPTPAAPVKRKWRDIRE